MNLFLRYLLFLGASISWGVGWAAEPCLGDTSSPGRYSVYLVPRQSATQLFHSWAPLLERIGKENKLCFELNITATFPEFENAMRTGKPDFIFFNPYHQVMVARSPGYVPLVRDEASRLAGVLVVRRDNPIRDIHQLEGATVAFPAPNAYVASLLIRATLARDHVHVTPDYVGSHNNVFRAVALGLAEAGGAANDALKSEPEELQSQLRVLFTTPFYIAHPFSAHPRVPPQVREKVIAGFLKMATDPEGREMLKAIHMAQPVRADYDRDYRELEALGLERFIVKEGH